MSFFLPTARLPLLLGASALLLTACASNNSQDSRYGDCQPARPCEAAVPQPYLVPVYPQPQPMPQPYPMPAPIIQAPVQQPIIVHAPAAPVVQEPEPIAPPRIQTFIEPEPEPAPPVAECPEGTIPSYGGRDCIPITVTRK